MSDLPEPDYSLVPWHHLPNGRIQDGPMVYHDARHHTTCASSLIRVFVSPADLHYGESEVCEQCTIIVYHSSQEEKMEKPIAAFESQVDCPLIKNEGYGDKSWVYCAIRPEVNFEFALNLLVEVGVLSPGDYKKIRGYECPPAAQPQNRYPWLNAPKQEPNP